MPFEEQKVCLTRSDVIFPLELISINAKPQALQVLHSIITTKKFRSWQAVLEKIMMKYIDLCVEMRKGKTAKEGLHQYRGTCQQYNNITSLENVVKHFLEQAEEKAKDAQVFAVNNILIAFEEQSGQGYSRFDRRLGGRRRICREFDAQFC
jgi:hypothetical protein